MSRVRSNLLGIGALACLVVAVFFAWGALRSPDQAAQAEVVRPDSRTVGELGDGRAVLVEFIDFECSACGNLYPVMEAIRERYAGSVTFVTRYFPIPSHANAVNAALAAEAAAEQGQFEAMYHRLFETQDDWANLGQSQAALFRQYASELGLNLAGYDAVVADPATLARVKLDQADGTALGVKGTPSFFLNGERFEPGSVDDVIAALDAALATDSHTSAPS